eukprot:s1187_g6.t1
MAPKKLSDESPSPDRTLKLSPSAPPRRSSDSKVLKKPSLKRPAASSSKQISKKPAKKDPDSSDSDETLTEKERRTIRQNKIYDEWHDIAAWNDSYNEDPPEPFEMYLAEQMLAHGWNYDGEKWTKKKQNHYGPIPEEERSFFDA